MVFVPHRLAYFTEHNALQFHPCCCKGYKLLLSLCWGSGEGTVRRGDYRNYYKGHMDKIKGEGGGGGGRGVQLGWGGGMGRKGTQL